MIQVEVRLGTADTNASFTVKVVDEDGNPSLAPFRSFLGKTFVMMSGDVNRAGEINEVHFVESK